MARKNKGKKRNRTKARSKALTPAILPRTNKEAAALLRQTGKDLKAMGFTLSEQAIRELADRYHARRRAKTGLVADAPVRIDRAVDVIPRLASRPKDTKEDAWSFLLDLVRTSDNWIREEARKYALRRLRRERFLRFLPKHVDRALAEKIYDKALADYERTLVDLRQRLKRRPVQGQKSRGR